MRYDGPMPYKNPGEKTWQVKVQDSYGKWHSRSTGTRDEGTALEIAKLVYQWRHEQKWELLDGITVKKTVMLKNIMRHLSKVDKEVIHQGKKEKRSVAALADAIVAQSKARTLSQWIDQWETDTVVAKYRGKIAKPEQKALYIEQMRRLVPVGSPLMVDWFADPENLKAALDALDVANETRRKYRTACSQFAKFLLRKKELTFNPVANGRVEIEFTPEELQARKEPKFYHETEVRRFLTWTPGAKVYLRRERRAALPVWRALHALLYGTGVEMQVAMKLRRRDFDMNNRIFVAEGTKNGFRNRMVGVVHDYCWSIVREYLMGLENDDAFFLPRAQGGKSEFAQMSVLYGLQVDACAELGIENLGFHKQRHSFTVANKDRFSKRFIQDQLGHAPNSTVIDTVYGKHTEQENLRATMRSLIAERKGKGRKRRRSA